jgi:hypothetical protein
MGAHPPYSLPQLQKFKILAMKTRYIPDNVSPWAYAKILRIDPDCYSIFKSTIYTDIFFAFYISFELLYFVHLTALCVSSTIMRWLHMDLFTCWKNPLVTIPSALQLMSS